MDSISKYALTLIIFLSSAQCFAQDMVKICSDVLPQYEITYSEAPIEYRFDKRARELHAEFSANENTLGYFHSNLNVEKKTIFKKINSKSCTELTGLELVLSFEPTLYVTREAQTFRCTLDRTLKHEHTHYKIEKDAFLALLQNIDVMVKEHFDTFNNNENIVLEDEVNTRINSLLAQMNNFLDEKTKSYHAFLDNEANYNAEAAICTTSENEMLDRLFSLNN